MLTSAQSDLVMVGLHTDNPAVFWKGQEVQGITDINVDWDTTNRRVKLRVNGNQDALYLELAGAGVNIKKEQ